MKVPEWLEGLRVELPSVPTPRTVSLSAGSTAVIIVDMQKDFVHQVGKLYVGSSVKETVPRIRRLLVKARRDGVHILYTQDCHPLEASEFKIWPQHCVQGTRGMEVIDELKPEPTDRVIKKTTYDAFYNTDLEEELRRLGVKNLVLVGTVSSICVLHTAGSAALRGFNIVVPVDCISALTGFDQVLALRQFTFLYRGTLTTADSITFVSTSTPT